MVMAKLKKDFDTHSELIVQPYKNGVQIIRPNNTLTNIQSERSVRSLFDLNMQVYFIDYESRSIDLNERAAENCGFLSTQSAIGNTLYKVATRKTAQIVLDHDQKTMQSDRILTRESVYTRLQDNITYTGLDIKFPWYNQNNKIIGVFGFTMVSVPPDKYHPNIYSDPLGKALGKIIDLGFFTSCSNAEKPKIIFPVTKIGNVYLTKRESQIMHLTMQGKTAKKIGCELGLSNRTIESYLSNIKDKFNVSTKYELVYKVREYLNLFHC